MKNGILLLCTVLIATVCRAQYKEVWQASVFSGKFISHAQRRIAPEQPQWGFTLDYARQTNGKKYWQFAHRYPQMGLSLTLRDLGNEAVYGKAISFLPYLEFNVLNSPMGALQIRHGTGLAYVTKQYHAFTNPQNTLLSTSIVASSIVDLGYRYRLSPQLDARIAFSLQHYSNGGFKFPNSGLNIGSVHGGLAYYPEGREADRLAFQRIKDFKRWRYRLGMSLGFFNYQPTDRSIETNTQLNGMAFYQHSTGFRTGLGLEADNLENTAQIAVYAEEEIQFGNLTTRYGFGGYVINKQAYGQDFYSKIGIAWFPATEKKIPGKFYIGSMLKAHRTKAAHVELNAGYVF